MVGTMERLLRLMAERKASDIYLSAHAPAQIRISGQMLAVNAQILPADAPLKLLSEVVPEGRIADLERTGELNMGIALEGAGNFRVSAMRQRSSYAVVVRYIASTIPPIDELNLPEILKTLIMEKRGLILMVGATGAGKSTAIALLHRAFDPQSGIIKIDGMDVRGLTLTALRRNIGVVFQEALLFNRSIADNLRVGKPDATEEEMRKAAERAQALEFIQRGDRKFETSAGERGRMLSGGERQRLSIARALLKDPPILILDEATSALDAVTEAKVNAALDEVMRGRTTFVIAHRLSTIRNATRILVFQNGKVIESGTFDELVARGGHFAELARAQFMVQEQARSETTAQLLASAELNK